MLFRSALDVARVRGGPGDLGGAHCFIAQRFAAVQAHHGVPRNVALRTQPDLTGLTELASGQHLVDVQHDVVRVAQRVGVQLRKVGEGRVERLIEQRMPANDTRRVRKGHEKCGDQVKRPGSTTVVAAEAAEFDFALALSCRSAEPLLEQPPPNILHDVLVRLVLELKHLRTSGNNNNNNKDKKKDCRKENVRQ